MKVGSYLLSFDVRVASELHKFKQVQNEKK